MPKQINTDTLYTGGDFMGWLGKKVTYLNYLCAGMIFISTAAFAQKNEADEKSYKDPFEIGPNELCDNQIATKFAAIFGYKRLQDVPELRNKVENAYREIFQTAPGKKWIRNLFACDPDELVYHLSISQNLAAEITQECISEYKKCNNGNRTNELNLIKQVLELQKTLKPPRCIQVFSGLPTPYGTLKTQGTIQSETDPEDNKLLLYLDRGDIDTKLLRTILTHELAVYFDAKGALVPDFLRANNLTARDLKPNISETSRVLSSPLIQNALSAIRAFAVEETLGNVIEQNEAALKLIKETQSNPASCIKSVERVIAHFLKEPTKPDVIPDDLWSKRDKNKGEAQLMWKNGLIITHHSDGSVDVKQRPRTQTNLSIVRKQTAADLSALSTLKVTVNGKEESLCTWITRPHLSPENIRFNQGPRPDIQPEYTPSTGGTLNGWQ